MAEVDLDALEGLLAESAAGPWDTPSWGVGSPDGAVVVGMLVSKDADLIAALRNEAPALLAELRRARELERGVGALQARLTEWEQGSRMCPDETEAFILDVKQECSRELRALLPSADGAREAPAADAPSVVHLFGPVWSACGLNEPPRFSDSTDEATCIECLRDAVCQQTKEADEAVAHGANRIAELEAAAPPAPTDGGATERALGLAVEALDGLLEHCERGEQSSVCIACGVRSEFHLMDCPTLLATQALAACRAALAGKEAGDVG